MGFSLRVPQLRAEGVDVRVAMATGRQAHYRLPANAFVRRQCGVSLYTATPRGRLRGFDPAVQTRWVPAPVAIFSALSHWRTPLVLDELDSTLFDRWAALALKECDLFLGASTSSLASGRAAKAMGATFVLDRACPDIRVQQAMMAEEAKKVGGAFRRSSPWFLERQVEEYETADFILTPSEYSRRSYPEHLRRKTVLAPLLGRSKVVPRRAKPAGGTFVLGAVGGEPLRKGFLYLLEAWKRLALPNARLMLRTGQEIFDYPVLKQLVVSQANVSIVGYVAEMERYFAECDAFILPSVDDGFGMALFEAMGNGVPSIATGNCGAAELLVPEQDFLRIDAFSVESIERAVRLLYESAETRQRLERNGPWAVEGIAGGGAAGLYESGIDHLLQRMTQRAAEFSAP